MSALHKTKRGNYDKYLLAIIIFIYIYILELLCMWKLIYFIPSYRVMGPGRSRPAERGTADHRQS